MSALSETETATGKQKGENFNDEMKVSELKMFYFK